MTIEEKGKSEELSKQNSRMNKNEIHKRIINEQWVNKYKKYISQSIRFY